MKYFRIFNNHFDYENFRKSDDYIVTNISICLEDGDVHISEPKEEDYSEKYLTFVAVEPSTFSFSQNAIEYSSDNGTTWKTLSVGSSTEEVGAGEKIMFKGNITSVGTPDYGIGIFSSTGKFNAEGNIMSLIYGDDFIDKTEIKSRNFERMFFKSNIVNAENLVLPANDLKGFCCRGMFDGCTYLETAPDLPATNLSDNCYRYMFYRCSSLRRAPELPATTLKDNCYVGMFDNCASLTTAPDLHATTMAKACCQQMFSGCTSLTTAPNLSATTMAERCYQQMFYGCTSLTTAPNLSATTLTYMCYYQMFFDCTSLTNVPSVLPATTLADSCYDSMFQNCTSIATAPSLPATTIANGCYHNTFKGCTSLTNVPSVLPATTLADSCYYGMFQDCSGLTTAPNLPATTLAKSCYQDMFYNCASLTTAPNLLATTLADGCYQEMFRGCSSLTNVPYELPATTLASSCYQSMFRFCTNLTIAPNLPATTLASNCYNEMFLNCTSLTTAPELPATTLASGCYSNMFRGCTSLTTAPNSIGDSSTVMTVSACTSMFQNCSGLTTAPELPATTLADSCYHQMFKECKNIRYIKCLATDISASNCTKEWLYQARDYSDCTFVKSSVMEDWTRDVNGIPSLWTVYDDTYIEVTSVTISDSSTTINKGETYALTATVLPNNATDKTVYWSTSDSTVSTVNSSGVVSGVGCGDATITVTTKNGSYTATCDTTVEKHITNINLTTGTLSLSSGSTYQLTAIIIPTDACDKSLNWQSSDNSIVTVNSDGVVSGVTTGNAVVTVTTVDGGYTAQCSVSVTEAHDYSLDYFTIESLQDSNEIKMQRNKTPNNPTLSYSLDNGETWTTVQITSTVTFATINSGQTIIFKGTNTKLASAWDTYNYFTATKQFKVYGNVMSLINDSGFTENSEFDNTKTNHLCGLFKDSTNLVDASNLILPAKTLYTNSYNGMFRGATSLQRGPQMLATTPTGTESCASMFEGCVNLEEPIDINFTTLSQQCCFRMFCMNRTSKITTPKMTKSPILRCYTAATDCYKEMFQGNGNLNEITCLLSDVGGTTDWVKNAGAASGVFYKNPNASWTKGGTGNVPSGWSIENYVEE